MEEITRVEINRLTALIPFALGSGEGALIGSILITNELRKLNETLKRLVDETALG